VTATAVDVAADRLQWLADHSPDAWRLARLASPAVRIEPHLLRSLRVELLPDADVGTEADLWFSPVVESQGVDAIVLDANVADLLRRDLASEAELFHRANDLIRRAHEHLPPALQLEERINAIALIGGAAAITHIDDELRAAIRAMTESAERAGEIARWVLRAWPRLHETVRNTPAAATLALAASALLRRRMTADPLAAKARLTELSWILPTVGFERWVELGVELLDTSLVFSKVESGPPLRVPDTKPPLVELEWYINGEQHVRVVDAEPGRIVELGGVPVDVRIGTLVGAEYVARREADTDSAAVETEPAWLDVSPFDTVADACVRVAPPGGTGTATEWTTAFYIDPRTLATSRWPLEGRDSVRIDPDYGTETPAINNAAIVGDVLLIEPATGVTHTEPVQLATPPIRAAAPEPGDDLQVEPTQVVILGHDGDTLRAVEGLAWVSDLEGREFAVTLDRRALPGGFIGGPVIIESRVRGLVASIEVRPAAPESSLASESTKTAVASPARADSVVCHIAGARAIMDAYEQLRQSRAARAAESSSTATGRQNARPDVHAESPEIAQQNISDFTQNAPDFAQNDESLDIAQEGIPGEPASGPSTGDAGGPRFARVVVVGDRGAGKSELIRALAEASSQSVDDRCTLAWFERPGRPGIGRETPGAGRGEGQDAGRGGPTGLVFHESTADPHWPIELDLENAALVVVAASIIEKPGASAQAWIRRIQSASALPLLIVGTQADANPEVAILAEREITALAAALEVRQGAPPGGGRGSDRVESDDAAEEIEDDSGAFEVAEPPRIVSARTSMKIDALRTSILDHIDWSAQPLVEPDVFEQARSSAARTLSSRPPIVGGTTRPPGDRDADWYDVLAPLAGERRVAEAMVIRDPSFFETLVLAIIEVAEKRFNNVPAARIDEVTRRWPDYVSRWPELSRVEVDPAMVIRGAAAELERFRLAITVMAGNTEVIAMPSLVGTGYTFAPDSSATRILSANWTGEVRDILVALVVRIAWEQATVRELSWDGSGPRGAAIVTDPDLFIEAAENRPTAELHVLTTDRNARLEAPRIAAFLREMLESLLRGNASLSFDQGEAGSYMA
jgi:GTPase SAR1 family protein